MPPRGEQRRRLLAFCAVTAATVPLAVAAAIAASPSSKPIVFADPVGDVSGPLDIQRAVVSRTSDGRLRAIVTFVGAVTPKDLLAGTGPPGSACVRIWTAPDADPTSMRPDRLVCLTAGKDEKLRAGVFAQRDAGLPRRTGAASVKAGSNGRSFAIRVSQSALGRPALIRFAIESTQPGCERLTCIDNVPDGGAVRRFRLRPAAPKAA